MSYGSGLRPAHQLQVIYSRHKDWSYLSKQLKKGAIYPIRKIKETKRIHWIKTMMKRGNHNLAEAEIETVMNLTEDDVKKGFAISLPRATAYSLKKTEIYPLRLASNQTYDSNGELIERKRLTHDLFYPIKKGVAINDRVMKDKLLVPQYGYALAQSLHHLHRLRQYHPMGLIMLNKRDFKDVYQRIHTWAHTAATRLVVVDYFLLILLRLPFSSSPPRTNFA